MIIDVIIDIFPKREVLNPETEAVKKTLSNLGYKNIEELVLSKQIKLIDKADKINVAALGNIVNQFHLHLIARHSGDAAWPGPVWGTGQAVPLLADTRDFRTQAVRKLLADFSS